MVFCELNKLIYISFSYKDWQYFCEDPQADQLETHLIFTKYCTACLLTHSIIILMHGSKVFKVFKVLIIKHPLVIYLIDSYIFFLFFNFFLSHFFIIFHLSFFHPPPLIWKFKTRPSCLCEFFVCHNKKEFQKMSQILQVVQYYCMTASVRDNPCLIVVLTWKKVCRQKEKNVIETWESTKLMQVYIPIWLMYICTL